MKTSKRKGASGSLKRPPAPGWRDKARELLPELQEELESAERPMAFWIDVCLAFENAYREPINGDLIRRIYEYAFWCDEYGERSTDAGHDVSTCVVVAFYEHIPTIPAARAEMPRWFTRRDVELMRDVFSYHLEPGEFEEILALYGPRRTRR